MGLTDSVLDWVRSFLTDRTQQIAYSGQLSSVQSVLFGVPQGSVLGPLLYVLHIAQLALVVHHHGLSLQKYADVMQVYISTPTDDTPDLLQCVLSTPRHGWKPADFNWTPPRPRWCGWVLHSSWRKSTFRRFRWRRHISRSRRWHETSASSSTAS